MRGPNAPVALVSVTPVSYTHLDVYKRQAQSEAAATPSEGPMEKQAAAPAAPRPGEWEEEEEEEDVPVKTKKAKKKKRKGPGCLVAVIAVFLVLVAAASFGISWYFNEINGNRGQNSYTATVTIEQGSGPLTIGRALQQQGIIRSAQIFRLYVRQQGVADTLQYGTFELSSAMSYDEIITALQLSLIHISRRKTRKTSF